MDEEYEYPYTPGGTLIGVAGKWGPVNFNFIFSFFAAHKIHGMDDRGYQALCLK